MARSDVLNIVNHTVNVVHSGVMIFAKHRNDLDTRSVVYVRRHLNSRLYISANAVLRSKKLRELILFIDYIDIRVKIR